jgi:hypothetical protein
MPPTSSPLSLTGFRIAAGTFMCLAYVALWLPVGLGADLSVLGEIVSVPFLPAAVRIIGFLLIGLWIIPFLLIAFGILTFSGAIAYPGLTTTGLVVLGLIVASAGPVAMALVTRLASLSRDVIDLGWRDLSLLCAVCAAGNALSYSAGLVIVGASRPSASLAPAIFLGDFMGGLIVLGLAALLLRGLVVRRKT